MIDKVHISKEAIFDFEEIVALKPMAVNSYRRELEEYFRYTNPNERYFTKKIYDEESEKMLLLFFRKGKSLPLMQIWILAGICDYSDYSELLDERGLIKNWLDNYIVA